MNKISAIERFRIDLRLFERAIDKLNKSNCCLGINVPQCHTIMEIGLNQSLTVKELASKMMLDKSTVSRQVDNLVKAGLISRKIPESDRRTVQITLSDKGAEIYGTMNEVINDQFKTVFSEIKEDELLVFHRVFHQISSRLNEIV